MTGREWEGSVHLLTVYEVGEPEGSIVPLRMLEYEVFHPSSCRQEPVSWDGEVRYYSWACDVEESIMNSDIEFSLHYSGTEITEPGNYLVRAWGRSYYVYDYGAYEYDGGIGVVAGPYPLERFQSGDPAQR